MSRRRHNTNPYPHLISDDLWSLLHKWAEWRSTKGTPRALPMPEETGKCHIRNGSVIFEPVGAVLEPHSTKPPEPSNIEVMNQCLMDLGEPGRMYLVVIVERQAEPWLKGDKWRAWFARVDMSKRDFKRELKAVLKRLAGIAKGRGLA